MKKLSKIISLLICLSVVLSICACDTNTEKSVAVTDDMSKHVELKWLIRSSVPQRFDEIMVEANKYLNEKLNVTLNLECIEPADYNSKVQLALASGEKVDIIWTSSGANPYEQNVAKGAYMALDEYLDLPELEGLKNHYSEGIWDATRMYGKIYGVPMEQVLYTQEGYQFHKGVVEKYDLEERIRGLSWVDDENHGTMEELEEVFDVVREGEAVDTFHIATTGFSTFEQRMTTIAGYNVIDGVVTDSPERFLSKAKRNRRWNEKGYFPADVATNDNMDALVNNGRVLTRYNRYLPGVEGKFKLQGRPFEVIVIPTSNKILERNSIQSTLSAISATSENPVRALKLLYLMHTDEYIMNLICYGIEGKDFVRDPENPRRMTRTSDYYLAEFLVGSQFLAYLAPHYEDDVWEETKRENEAADIDEYIGFSFDSSAVESERSQCSAVATEYSKIITCGLEADVEAIVEERQKKLKLAGADIVLDEIQRQLDEWKATQK